MCAYFLGELLTDLFNLYLEKYRGCICTVQNSDERVFITWAESSDDPAQEVADYLDIRFYESLEPIRASPHGPNKFINLSLEVAVLKNRACPLTQMLLGRLMKFSLKGFCILGGNT
jgi:hypothetical protein